MSVSSSSNHPTFLGHIINLFTFKLPHAEVEKCMSNAVDVIMEKGKNLGLNVSKELPTNKNELIQQVYEKYNQKDCSVETLLNCRLFKELTNIKEDEAVKANLPYLKEDVVPSRLDVISKTWNSDAAALKTNQAFVDFLGRLLSGLARPDALAKQQTLYKNLPTDIAETFKKGRTELSNELAGAAGRGTIRKKDLQLMIQMLEFENELAADIASRYMHLLISPSYAEHFEILKANVQQFIANVIEANQKQKHIAITSPIPNPLIALTLQQSVKEEENALTLQTNDAILSAEFMKSRQAIDSDFINHLAYYVTPDLKDIDLGKIASLIDIEKDVIYFAANYYALISSYKGGIRKQLKTALIQGLNAYKDSPEVKE